MPPFPTTGLASISPKRQPIELSRLRIGVLPRGIRAVLEVWPGRVEAMTHQRSFKPADCPGFASARPFASDAA